MTSIALVFAVWVIPIALYYRYARAMRAPTPAPKPAVPLSLADRFITSDDPPALSLPVFEDDLDDQVGLTLARAKLAKLRRENDCVRRGVPYVPPGSGSCSR